MHSLGSADFEDKDADAARAFGQAAARAGAERIIYLGGLGEDDGDLSAAPARRAARSRPCSGRRACR